MGKLISDFVIIIIIITFNITIILYFRINENTYPIWSLKMSPPKNFSIEFSERKKNSRKYIIAYHTAFVTLYLTPDSVSVIKDFH